MRLTRILICLLLGALSTVAAAWALALTIPPMDWGASRESREMLVGTERPRWVVGTVRDLGALDIFAIADSDSVWLGDIDESQVPGWSRAAHPPASDEVEDGFICFIEYARGWPMLSLYWRETYARTRRSEWGWEIELLRRFTKDPDSPTMPLAVIWPGFLIDTLFYAAPWFGLLFGIGAARRKLRTRRGRCPTCGYDLRGDLETGCPECGWGRAEAEGQKS